MSVNFYFFLKMFALCVRNFDSLSVLVNSLDFGFYVIYDVQAFQVEFYLYWHK